MYYCKNCGKQIDDDAIYCPYCGVKQIEDEEVTGEIIDNYNFENLNNYQEENNKPVITFGLAIKNLFVNIFRFNGRQTRKEFNFQLLFVYLINLLIILLSTALSKEYNNYLKSIDYNNLESIEPFVLNTLLDSYFIGRVIAGLIAIIFLSAPIYRRFNDTYRPYMKIVGVIAIIIYGLSLMSLGMFINPNGLLAVDALLTIIDIASIIVILMGMVSLSRR